MSSIERLAPRFVDTVPETLVAGVLYVSTEHGVMMHLCACGCGCEVSLPLSPIDWRLTFDGVYISVSPSVGNWSLPCRSHYVIDRNYVRWAGDWTQEQIEKGRSLDFRRRNARHSPAIAIPADGPGPICADADHQAIAPRRNGLLATAWHWVTDIAKRW